ncbi:uncharacterized protein LOC115219223 isoform X1 [Octopus sinensis]|uniref:Uncharacterized protein LOC115219223 isoform X1 n=1 Tax=Octopus sinensis TaxID=2607531 RepID=A0A6P7T362_9MOLL|nr:uncharacterized protein LOC115219223 isoform X1 [Octopus sinensis]
MAYFFSNNLLLILIGIAEILEIIQGYQLGQWFIEVQSAKLSSSESQTITEINITGTYSSACANWCLSWSTCHSFVFNEELNQCMIYPTSAATESLVPVNGYNYYQLIKYNKEKIMSILGASFAEKYSTQRFYSTLQECKLFCLKQALCSSFTFCQTDGLCLLSNLTFSQLNLEAKNSRWSSYQLKGKQSTGNPILPTTQSSLQNGEVMTSWKLQLFRTSDVIMKYGILVQIQSRTIFVFDTRRNSVVSNDGGQQIVVDTFTFQMLTRQGRLKSFLLWCLQQIDVNDNCIGLEVSLIVLTNLNTGQVYSSVFNKELTPIPSTVYV